MATKRTIELGGLETEALKKELADLETNLSKMTFDHAVRGLENPMIIGDSRKSIAKINTELRRRELAAMSEVEVKNRSKIRLRRKLKN